MRMFMSYINWEHLWYDGIARGLRREVRTEIQDFTSDIKSAKEQQTFGDNGKH